MEMPPPSSYTGAPTQPLNSNSQSSSQKQGQTARDGRRYIYYKRTRKSNWEKSEESKTPFEEWEAEELKRNIAQYRAFLESCDFIKANTQWRKVQDRLEDDERCLRLDKQDRLEIFQEYMCDLEDNQKIQKEQLRQKERKNQDEFRRLMEGHKTTGFLTENTHWLDYLAKVKDHPAYLAMASNTSGSPPKDLFEDVVEEMKKQYQKDKANITDALKAGKLGVTSTWTLDKFNASIGEVYDLATVSKTNLKLVFEEVLEKAKEKKEKEATTDCPSEILAEFAKGPFDPKSPLKQFATQIGGKPETGGGTRKWRCNMCGVERSGSLTRINAHFLFIRGKGVGPCAFLEQAANVKYRIEINKLWDFPNDSAAAMLTSFSCRAKVKLSEPHASNHTSQMRGVMSGPSSTQSVVAQSQEAKGKHKLHSNPIAEFFNVKLKDEIDDAIRKFFNADGIPFHVAESPYFKDMISMVGRGGPSYVPPGENQLKTMCTK